MGKRPRTPHFITGIGDGNVHNTHGGGDDPISQQQQQQQKLRGGPNVPQQQQNELDSDNGGNNIKSNTNNVNPYSGRYHHLVDNHQQGGGGGGGGGGIIDRYSSLRSSQSNNERLQRLEEPLSWGSNPLGDESKLGIGGGDGNDMMLNAGNGFYSFGTTGGGGVVGDGGPWQVSAFAFLGMVVVMSVIFLHFVSESGSDGSSSSTASSATNSGVGPYHYRRRQRQRRKHQMRKKKTDEWSDDEEPIQDGAGLLPGNTHSSLRMDNPSAILGGGGAAATTAATGTLPGESSYDSSDFDYYENTNNQNSLSSAHMYPYYYQQQQQEQQQNNPTSYSNRFETQDSRLRKTSSSNSGVAPGSGNRNRSANSGSNYAMPSVGTGLVPTYKSPAPNMLGLAPRVPARGVSPMDSYSSNNSGSHASNYGSSPGMQRSTIDLSFATNAVPTAAPISGRLRVPSTPEAKDVFQTNTSDTRSSTHGGSGNHVASATATSLLPPPPEESPLLIPKAMTVEERHLLGPPTPVRYQVDGTGGFSTPRATKKKGVELKARPLTSSNSSSFDSLVHCHNEASGGTHADSDGDDDKRSGGEDGKAPSSFDYQNQFVDPSSERSEDSSFHYSSKHNQSLTLSPGNAYEETPIIGNVRRVLDATVLESPGLGTPNLETPMMNSALLPPVVSAGEQHGQKANNVIPFMPSLGSGSSEDGGSREKRAVPEQPRSILMDELRLVQMETGSMHWEVQGGHLSLEHADVEASEGSFFDQPFETEKLKLDQNEQQATLSSEEGSDISIPSGDPRKGIVHKRSNLTMSTDSATSLQSSINFSELQLQEVIGGGGFGQVWRASWRGTPVAVKVLTGSAQNTHIAKAILEEFKAEINLLKGMRHPNICLYMGACLDPPNRAIITELAANGSVWDALRLPLMPPYVVADGTSNGSWPMRLYIPGQHGAPPSSGAAKISAPIPPRGTWPWELVKRVSCGAARGMAYLHSGNPPVLHRDLKSANLLLDESYTTKVCDFGLSRLKAQARSMTGNCGTVQWMAPEVLANHDYDEKADVFSFGIIVWELLSRECPYEGMTAIQCALAVLNRDKRPEIPKWCPPGLHALIKSCVKKDPSQRPSFEQIILALDAMD